MSENHVYLTDFGVDVQAIFNRIPFSSFGDKTAEAEGTDRRI
jgi:hypothetical protein